MLKIYFSAILALFLIGCGTESPNVKSRMFQSVEPQQATILQHGKHKNSCAMCGMNLVKYYKTNHAAQHKGKTYQYCSIHCLEDHLGKGITLKNPQVVDVESLKFIRVVDAYYVVGSKKRGTMSKISKYAFKDLAMAKKFQAKFGGEIMNFNKAREIAQKDFKYYGR
jgi:nitrous oxide reductase accessory protein NosL